MGRQAGGHDAPLRHAAKAAVETEPMDTPYAAMSPKTSGVTADRDLTGGSAMGSPVLSDETRARTVAAEHALRAAVGRRDKNKAAATSAEQGAIELAFSADHLLESVQRLATAAGEARAAATSMTPTTATMAAAAAAAAAGTPASSTNPERDRGLAAPASGRDAGADAQAASGEATRRLAKMEEINKATEELWQRAYKGGDIESIVLRGDAGDGVAIGGNGNGFCDGSFARSRSAAAASASSSAAAAAPATGAPIVGKAARSCKYRLVMTRGGVELAMRDHCSAGQKALASIVVRLALAKVLAVSCGILDLDEPCTNLDEDNAAALSASLNELVDTNLQLVVITRDMAFARRLLHSNTCTWMVEMDDKHYSQIRKLETGEGLGGE